MDVEVKTFVYYLSSEWIAFLCVVEITQLCMQEREQVCVCVSVWVSKCVYASMCAICKREREREKDKEIEWVEYDSNAERITQGQHYPLPLTHPYNPIKILRPKNPSIMPRTT